MNRRIPDGTYGGVRGRELVTPSYSIFYDYWSKLGCIEIGYNNERQAARTDCA